MNLFFFSLISFNFEIIISFFFRKPISLVTDNELFHVDLARKDEVLTKSRKRKILLEKPPKCFSMLEPHTKVPAFNR